MAPPKMTISSASPSPTTTHFQIAAPTLHTTVPTEAGGLYIFLSDTGDTIRWHWGLYLAHDAQRGRVMHWRDEGGKFRYESADTGAPFDGVVLMLKIGEMEAFMQGALVERVGRTAFLHGVDACKTWLMRVLTELDNEGWIVLSKNAGDVEREAMDWAFEKTARRTRGAEKSRYSMESV